MCSKVWESNLEESLRKLERKRGKGQLQAYEASPMCKSLMELEKKKCTARLKALKKEQDRTLVAFETEAAKIRAELEYSISMKTIPLDYLRIPKERTNHPMPRMAAVYQPFSARVLMESPKSNAVFEGNMSDMNLRVYNYVRASICNKSSRYDYD